MAICKIARNIHLLKSLSAPPKPLLNLSTDEFAAILITQYGPALSRMITEAELSRKEAGAMICMAPDGTFHLGVECWGRSRSVTLTDCKERSVGSFHVHLLGSDTFSPADLSQGLSRELFSCLGYMKNGAPKLKVVGTHLYSHLPQVSRTLIRRGIAEADQDIHNAIMLAPTEHRKALVLTDRAHKTLQGIEKLLNVYETDLQLVT